MCTMCISRKTDGNIPCISVSMTSDDMQWQLNIWQFGIGTILEHTLYGTMLLLKVQILKKFHLWPMKALLDSWGVERENNCSKARKSTSTKVGIVILIFFVVIGLSAPKFLERPDGAIPAKIRWFYRIWCNGYMNTPLVMDKKVCRIMNFRNH